MKNLMKDKRTKTLIIAIIIALLVAIISTSYAFFTISNKTGSEETITSGTMALTLHDGPKIETNFMIPGEYIEKTFYVTNTGSLATSYDIYLSEVVNDFADKTDLVYTLTSSDGGYSTPSQVQVPSTETKIVDSQSIGTSTTHHYTLRITFLNKNEAQDDNQGKHFSGKLQINEYQAAPSGGGNNGGGSNPSPSLQPTVISGDLDTIGSEVTLGDEEFFVIGKPDSTHVKLITKYKLDENNMQSADYYVDVPFSSSDYFNGPSYKTSPSLIYYNEASTLNSPPDDPDEPFTPIYASMNLYEVYDSNASVSTKVDTYVTYLNSLGYSVTGRLLLFSEDVTSSNILHGYCEGNDGCGSLYVDPSNIGSSLADALTYTSEYWTGTAFDEYDSIMIISGRDNGNYATYGYYNEMGVRPVIIATISAS